MTEIRFYHLQSQVLEEALPLIVEKALARSFKVLIRAEPGRLAALDEALWTYSKDSFLPHGTRETGHAERQPVYLTEGDDNPNAADLLILTDGRPAEKPDDYKLCCDIFDGADPRAIEKARQRWVDYKAAGHAVSYFQQDDSGRWEQKAAG